MNERVDAPCADDRGMIACTHVKVTLPRGAALATHSCAQGRREGSTVEYTATTTASPLGGSRMLEMVRVATESERDTEGKQHAPPPFCTSKLCTHGRRLCRGLNTNTGGGVRKCAVRKGWAPPSAASTLAPIPTFRSSSTLTYYLSSRTETYATIWKPPPLTPVASLVYNIILPPTVGVFLPTIDSAPLAPPPISSSFFFN